MTARLALALLLLLPACSSDEEDALRLAAEACENVPTPIGTPEPLDAAGSAAAYEESAKAAARAARLDPEWDDLAGAYSRLAEAWQYLLSLPRSTDGSGKVDPARLTEEQRTRIRDVLTGATKDEQTIRSECRQATA